MSGRGKFSGFNWHVEYHTTDKKKEKAADCIYLTNDRICQNKQSGYYLSKCFVASNCKYKVKEKDKIAANNTQNRTPTPAIIRYRCVLPPKCKVTNIKFGEGTFVDYSQKKMLLNIKFSDGVRLFKYPEAIINKHLLVSDTIYEQVLREVKLTQKGQK